MKSVSPLQVLIGVFRVVLSMAGFGVFMLLVGTFITSALRGEPIYWLLGAASGFMAITALVVTVNQAQLLYQTSGSDAVAPKLS